MKSNFSVLFFLCLLVLSCNKEDNCNSCICFKEADPVRISFIDNSGNDLLGSNDVIVDSIVGIILETISSSLVDTTFSDKPIHIPYNVSNASTDTIAPYYIEIASNKFVSPVLTSEVGYDQVHTAFIYCCSGEKFKLDLNWSRLLTDSDQCCTCYNHNRNSFSINDTEISEFTSSGAGIVRR